MISAWVLHVEFFRKFIRPHRVLSDSQQDLEPHIVGQITIGRVRLSPFVQVFIFTYSPDSGEADKDTSESLGGLWYLGLEDSDKRLGDDFFGVNLSVSL